MEKYIGKKMIEDGLISKVIIPKLENYGLKIYIGDNWFYCGGTEFEFIAPQNIPFPILVEEIKNVLDDFYDDGNLDGEYLYYYYYLCENI